MSASEMPNVAYIQPDADWGTMEPGSGWGVYPWGSPPLRLPHENRCEAGCLSLNVMVRCLLQRGHFGLHVGHP